MDGKAIVNVNGVTVKYKDLTAVDNISFQVEDGEIFGIIGPNGAGKTSIIECLEGLRRMSGGTADVFGINPADRRELYKHIGVQLQEASFPNDIKVEELCLMFASFYENPADYNALLERFGLADRKKDYVKKLSGGQRQKISIVTALIANPRILFLDELTTGLDPRSRINMWELIKSLRDEGKTILMTTHFMDEAEYLCDRVCLMVAGKIYAMGTVKELVEQSGLNYKVSFSCENPDPESLRELGGVTEIKEHDGVVDIYGNGKNMLRNVAIHLAESDVEFDDLSFTKPGLEDVFLKMTGFRLEETP